tara:strand:- start:620 stop:844 length:225 start_codon:yes stop_codon:yes gene_type:complete
MTEIYIDIEHHELFVEFDHTEGCPGDYHTPPDSGTIELVKTTLCTEHGERDIDPHCFRGLVDHIVEQAWESLEK